MADLVFPSSPVDGQEFPTDKPRWKWSASAAGGDGAWELIPLSAGDPSTAATAASQAIAARIAAQQIASDFDAAAAAVTAAINQSKQDAADSAEAAAETLANAVPKDSLASEATVPAYDYPAAVIQKILDTSGAADNYAELRLYASRSLLMKVRAPGVTGFFWRDDSDTTSADNGCTVIIDALGRRWKRIYDGAINVKWLGAKGDGITDDTVAINAAIAVATELNFPAGNYRFSKIAFKSNLRITCSGYVVWQDIPGDGSDCFISCGQNGFIQNWILNGMLRIVGVGNTTIGGPRNGMPKIGMLLDSTPDGTGQGGNWYVTVNDVRIYGFSGHELWFKGGPLGSSSEVNQFICFRNVYAKAAVAGAYGLFMSGKNGQIDFIGSCLFEHDNKTDIAARITRHANFNGALSGSDGRAYIINLKGASFQKGSVNLQVERGYAISADTIYMEDGANGALFTDSCESCYISGVAANTHAAGTAVAVGTASANGTIPLTVGPMQIMGDGSVGFDGGTGGAGTGAAGIDFETIPSFISGTTATPYKNCTAQPGISSNTIAPRSRTTAIVSSGTISTLTSNIAPGQRLSVKAHNGPLTITSGGNITIPNGMTQVVVPRDAVAEFIKMDLGGNFLYCGPLIGADRQGFFGTTPIARQSLAAASTDLASVITLANDMRTKLQALGLFT